MQRVRNLRPSPAMVIACLALIVALGGTSIAAVSALPPNSVGTAQLKNGAVTATKLRDGAVDSTKVSDGSLVAADFAPGALPGPGQAALWAVVRPAPGATMTRSSGATSLSYVAKGVYVVTFNRDVSKCAWLATAANPASALPGLLRGYFTVVAAPQNNANGVQVATFDDSGNLADYPFHVAVLC